MLKRILATAAPIALLAIATVPAHAADYRNAAPAPSYNSWADLTMAFGIGRYTDGNDNSNTLNMLRGEGRFGMAIGGAMLQLDVAGDSNNHNGDGDNNPTVNLAAHLGMMTGILGGLGLMISTGDTTDFYGYDRYVTIAGEGTWNLGALGPARLTAQAGWTMGTQNTNVSIGYIHGVLDFMVGQNVMLSVNLGYASDNNSNVTWRYGAKVEAQLMPQITGFLAWDAAHITNGGGISRPCCTSNTTEDNNRVMVGATFSVGGAGLANRSPFHDFNPATGINHLFDGS